MFYITLDTGTTNTRITLWDETKNIDKVSSEIGVRNTAIDGNNSKLKKAVKSGIEKLLLRNKLNIKEIEVILASGMITSNVGLVEVPHLIAPIGLKELASGMIAVKFPEIIDKDIWFVPGVKNNIKNVTFENFEKMDIMRGEEVETIGLLEKLNIKEKSLIILPGSHSKFVSVNKECQIESCLTSMAGELISVISLETIVANSLNNSLASSFDKDSLIKGFRSAQKIGINRTIFSIRILDQFTNYTVNEKANFLIGAILSGDLKAIKESNAITINKNQQIIIGGKKILKDSFECILKEDNFFTNIKVVDDEDMKDLAGFGVFSIAKKKKLI